MLIITRFQMGGESQNIYYKLTSEASGPWYVSRNFEMRWVSGNSGDTLVVKGRLT